MKRKLLLGTALFLASASLAQAADPMPAETYDSDWSGVYGTLSGGYAAITLDAFGVDPPFEAEDNDTSDGAIFGAGLGYNHDFGSLVLGLEGDISLLTNEHELNLKETVEVDYDWFATGRVRAGFDFDETLVYATGGIASLSADFESDDDSHSETFFGWTGGFGIEHRVYESVSLRIEGLYADFGSEEFGLEDDELDIDADMFIIRGGISWYFL